MAETTHLDSLKINILTKEQFTTAEKDPNQLYLISDEEGVDLSVATPTEDGLMSASDKDKLDKIEDGANKTTVINDLTSTSTTSALSAAMGKSLADNKVDKDGNKVLSTNDYTTTEKNKLAGIDVGANKTIIDTTLSTTSTNPVQNKVITTEINNLNTLVGDTSVADQITEAIKNKADTTHKHTVSDVTDLTATAAELNKLDGVTATTAELNYIAGVTSNIQTQLNSKSPTVHEHSEYVNQNAFSNVKVGATTVAADTATDTLTLVAGSNVTITPNATSDSITINATNTEYTHPNSGVTAGTYKSVTVNAQGHVTGGTNPTTLSGYGITDAASKDAVDALTSLVGDTAVSAQITEAIKNKSDVGHAHVIGDVTNLQNTLNAKYVKPSTGVPKSDLAADVQTSLGKADTAVQSLSGYATEGYVNAAVSNLVDSAPETLDTLNELATALGNDPNFATTVATEIGKKVDKDGTKVLSDNNYTTPEKNKLAGIADGATKVTIDSAMSTTSTNPVQNKIISEAINNLNTLVGDTEVSTQIANAVAKKADLEASYYTVSATGDGTAYTAAIPGLTTLSVGTKCVIVPDTTSTTSSPTLNVNGLGAKGIRRRLSSMPTSLQAGYSTTWITANKPFSLVYDGTYWIVDGLTKPAASDLYGSLSKDYTVEIPVAWTADATNGGYTQTVNVAGILETDTPIVDVVLVDSAATNKTLLKAYSCITRITTHDGYIKLWANDNAPESIFTIQMKVVK